VTRPGPERPRWVYVLPEYDPKAAHHFGHVAPLLERLARRTELVVVIERATGPVRIPGAARVIVQRRRRGLPRLFEIFVILWRLNARGFRTCFVRISTPASLMAIAVRRLRGGRVFIWRSGQGKEFNPRLGLNRAALRSKFFVEMPFKLTLWLTDFFVTGPKSMAEYFAKNWRVRPGKIRILYNDVDLARFTGSPDPGLIEAWRQRLAVPPGAKVVLSVARFSPVRRMDLYLPSVMVRTLRVRPEAFFVIAGDGVDFEKIRRSVARTGLADRIKLLGAVPAEEVSALYALADVFLLPSYTEGFPRVLLEAMAFGRPVVSTDAGGIRDILPQSQQAFVSDRRDPDGLARNLIALLADDGLAARLAAANQARVQDFDVGPVADMYYRVLFEGQGAL
jgi:glycosyltransferase involved in cell wall biosynthesis